MHATIPLAGAGLTIGILLLFLVCAALAAWCFLCYRVGVWLAGGCGLAGRPAFCASQQQQQQQQGRGQQQQQQMQQCGAPNPGAAREPRAGGGKKHRRPDRPSSAIGMMLVLLLVCLAVFGLMRTRSVHHAFSMRSVSDKAAIKVAEDAKSPTWTVTGHGVTKDDAEQIAMEAAYASVLNYVEREMPAPHWTPSADYVAKKLITSKTTTDLKQAGLDPETQKTTMQVELNAPAYRDILRRGRMLFLVKVLGALVLVLATIATYLRLDDMGKGYYTGWLRLGTAVIVTGVIVGLLSVFGVFARPLDASPSWLELSSLPLVPLAVIGAVVFLSLHLFGRKTD